MKKLILLTILAFITSCSSTQLQTAKPVVESLCSTTGISLYQALPSQRSKMDLVCALHYGLDSSLDPVQTQAKLKDAIGSIWVGAGDVGAWSSQIALNAMVRFMDLNTNEPSKELITFWHDSIDQFCKGIEIAKKSEGAHLTLWQRFLPGSNTVSQHIQLSASGCGVRSGQDNCLILR